MKTNIISISFFCLLSVVSAHAAAYSDKLVGPMYLTEIPLSYSKAEIEKCLASLKPWKYGAPQLKGSCDDIPHVDESAALGLLAIESENLMHVPTNLRYVAANGCEIEAANYSSSAPDAFKKRLIQISYTCTAGTTQDEIRQAISAFAKNAGVQKISVLSRTILKDSEPALLASGQVAIDAQQCLASLKSAGNDSFRCMISKGDALNETNRLRGFVADLPIETEDYKIDLNRAANNRGYTLEVRYFDKKGRSTVDQEIRQAFEKILAAHKTLDVKIPIKASVQTSWPTTELKAYERTVSVDLELCKQKFGSWRESASCSVGYPIATQDIGLIEFGGTQVKKSFSIGKTTFQIEGGPFSERKTSGGATSGLNVYYYNSAGYSVRVDRINGQQTSDSEVQKLIEYFHDEVVSFSSFLVR